VLTDITIGVPSILVGWETAFWPENRFWFGRGQARIEPERNHPKYLNLLTTRSASWGDPAENVQFPPPEAPLVSGSTPTPRGDMIVVNPDRVR
jgi:hypothetical protein